MPDYADFDKKYFCCTLSSPNEKSAFNPFWAKHLSQRNVASHWFHFLAVEPVLAFGQFKCFISFGFNCLATEETNLRACCV